MYKKLPLILLNIVFICQCAHSAERPNIIFVMTDDQGYGDFAAHGHPFLNTPNLDKLYAQSTRFTDYHVSATCSPTRAALMSGKQPFEVGVTHTILERERMALGLPTIADILKGEGYATGIFGKWHLGEADAYQPGSRGFDEVFIHGAGGIGQRFEGSQADVPGNGYFDPTIRHNGTFVKTRGFCTDVFFKQALGWIKENKQKPFFAYIATNAPHAPFLAPEPYKAMYRDHVSGDEKDAAFFGMITNIDDNMGVLMEKLDAWGLSENTLLIYTTDNGTARGAKYFNAGMNGRKGSPHEGGARVPLFFRLPGLTEAGRDLDQLSRHIDIFPTLAELVGADIAALGLEGRSLLPLLKDPHAAWPDRHLFFHVARWPKAGAKSRFGQGDTNPDNWRDLRFSVRTEKWRMVTTQFLYDIENDPGEQTNVIERYPEIASDLLKRYRAYWDQARPLMVNEDAPLDVERPFEASYLKQKETQGIPEWAEPKL